MSKEIKSIIVAALIIPTLILVINPGGLWMPDMVQMTLAVVFLILFSVFAVFVMGERTNDEREQLHKLLAGHTAFLIGSALLAIAVLVQAMNHDIDPWLVVALGGMILTKLIGMIWAHRKK